jgi:hypothetical protein
VKAGLAIFGLCCFGSWFDIAFAIIKFTIRYKISKILHGDGRIETMESTSASTEARVESGYMAVNFV